MSDPHSENSRLVARLRRLRPHDHLCLIYETQQEQLSAAIPFIRDGFERGEKCLYVADQPTAAGVFDAMRAEGIDVDAALRGGALSVANKQEKFLKQGRFDRKWMLQFFEGASQEAKQAGFPTLRIIAEMTWVLGGDSGTEELMVHEATFNYFFRDRDALAICQYNRARFAPEVILDVIRTHPIVIYGGIVCENPYYIPPDEFLAQNAPALEVQRLLKNLCDAERTRETLRSSEERWRSIFENSGVGIAMTELDGRFVATNRAYQKLVGYSHEELQTMTFLELTHEDDRRANWELITQLLGRERQEFQIEKRYRRKDGRSIWVRNTVSLIPGAEGSPRFIVAIVEDVTARKRAEEELRVLSGRLLQLQDEERRRIARELHDSTAQDLAALTTDLAILSNSIPATDSKTRNLVFDSLALAEKSARDIRTLSYVLHPPLLDEGGLTPALQELADGFTKRSGIRVDLDLPPELGRLPQEAETALFRVVQESLNNIHSHSGSSTARIRLARCAAEIRLEVKDKGVGIPPGTVEDSGAPSARLGVGIRGMRERLRQLGGRLEVISDGHGTEVRAILPLH